MAKHQPEEIQIAVIANNIENIKADVKDIKFKLDSQYVTKEAFEPIRKIVYGLVSLILVGVVGATLAIVLKK